MPLKIILILLLILSVNLSIFAQGETGYVEVEKDIRLFYQKIGTGITDGLQPRFVLDCSSEQLRTSLPLPLEFGRGY